MSKTGTKTGIGYSPLTECVYLGKLNLAQGLWVGHKEDITSDFIDTILAFVPENTNRTVQTKDGSKQNIIFNIKNDPESREKAINWLKKQK